MTNNLEPCGRVVNSIATSPNDCATGVNSVVRVTGELALSQLQGKEPAGVVSVQCWKLRPAVMTYGAVAASSLGLLLIYLVLSKGVVHDRGQWAGGWIHLLIVICNICVWMGASGGIHVFRLPRYVAANGNGIAFGTGWQWRAVLWTDIAWAAFGPRVNQIGLLNGRVIPIRFLPLKDEALEQIQLLIVSRAELDCISPYSRGYRYRRMDPFLDT